MEQLAKFKRQQKMYLIAAPLTAFLALMKFLGIFALGYFPFYVELVMAVYCLFAAFQLKKKVSKLESSQSDSL